MAGYLIQVNYTDSSVAKTMMIGIDFGMFASATGAITAAKNIATVTATAKGQAPINVTAAVNQTR